MMDMLGWMLGFLILLLFVLGLWDAIEARRKARQRRAEEVALRAWADDGEHEAAGASRPGPNESPR